MSMKSARTIREPLKKPRPLKSTSSSEQIKFQVPESKDVVVHKSKADILADLEALNVSISNCNFDEFTAADVSTMCAILKKRGEELDSSHKDAVDRYFSTLRNAAREDRLDIISRLKLLEVIEIRAMGWKTNENLTNYYNSKIQELEQGIDHLHMSGSTSPSISFPLQNQNLSVTSGMPLAPGEIIRSSGKFAKPTKIAGKNYFKDEIVIRNSDSGKVMGIKGRRVHMIEELSDTVISFQRVNPGARDRLVQITGPHEEAIGHAKLLVEDTIRRNASPIRENADTSELGLDAIEHTEFGSSFTHLDNQSFVKKQLVHSYSMSDASVKEYCIPVHIGHDVIKLSGNKSELLKTAKLVLTEYFAGQTKLQEKQYESLSSMSIQSPSENNMQRFELQRQPSLKKNMLESLSSSRMNDSSKRESISPFSSSDDDVGKDDVNIGLEKDTAAQVLPYHVSLLNAMNTKKTQSSTPVQIPNTQGNFNQSASIPKDYSSFDSFSDSQEQFKEEVSSPLLAPSPADIPIPPPSYKKKSYSREFLLNCANSPFSHNQPADYAHIHQNFQDIICKSPVMFDPSKYRQKEPQFEDSSGDSYK